MDLTNASAVVTGGAGGFGAATVRRLARMGAKLPSSSTLPTGAGVRSRQSSGLSQGGVVASRRPLPLSMHPVGAATEKV